MKDYDKKLYENVEDLMIQKAVASIHKVVFFSFETAVNIQSSVTENKNDEVILPKNINCFYYCASAD